MYKQTVLPLSKYVSFIMCLNNKQDIDKLQVLQNRALRMCFNIQNPRDISIQRLHEMAKVDMLYKRRMLQLLSIIYDIRSKSLYQHHHARNVRWADTYAFEIKRANIELYIKSPFYVGCTFWNDLPKNSQDIDYQKVCKRTVLDLLYKLYADADFIFACMRIF